MTKGNKKCAGVRFIPGACGTYHGLIKKNIVLFFLILLHLPVFGQPNDIPNRQPEIEKLTEEIYSATEFQRIVDSLQLSVDELSCYPVISPVKQPMISSGFGMRIHPIYKVRKFHTGIDFSEKDRKSVV